MPPCVIPMVIRTGIIIFMVRNKLANMPFIVMILQAISLIKYLNIKNKYE